MPNDLMKGLVSFKDILLGETIIVCGCGESLNDLKHPERFITIGVNDIGRLFHPNYLVVVNPRNQFSSDRFLYVEKSQSEYLFTQLDLGVPHPNIVKFNLGTYGGTGFSDPNVLHFTRNSPYIATCLAVLMGAKRIGLIGVDFTENHFFGKTGSHPLADQLLKIDAEYRALGEALEKCGIEVINLSKQSRLTAFKKYSSHEFQERFGLTPVKAWHDIPLRIVSYATTPIAGVPAILSRCISATTEHQARCVWETNRYDNGVIFAGDVEWNRCPAEAEDLIAEADVIIAHNGKINARHERLLKGKPVITLAHNYLWNVDTTYVDRGFPGLVVAQYQATLPEFKGWAPVPNPIPLWERDYQTREKNGSITLSYTPSGRHERYPEGHRLYWHAKGYDTTMRALEHLGKRYQIRVETVRHGHVSHAESLAMKQRAHIVIDECVTGSYHRCSLEGLAAGCVVVNGVGLLDGVIEMLHRCAPDAKNIPFLHADLTSLEQVLNSIIESGIESLSAEGRLNRQWMERHWDFVCQWRQFWWPQILRTVEHQPAVKVAVQNRFSSEVAVSDDATFPNRNTGKGDLTKRGISVVVPHGGRDRLRYLKATVANMMQLDEIDEVIVVEMGSQSEAEDLERRWGSKCRYIFAEGDFGRARALNIGSAAAKFDLILWNDNDLLVPRGFAHAAAAELYTRNLDFLIPYHSISYLSEEETESVLTGAMNPSACKPVKTLYSGRDVTGGSGLIRKNFIERYGGLIEEFKGWGGEDNAWIHKIDLLGKWGFAQNRSQCTYHLYHRDSGAHIGRPLVGNPFYAHNLALLQEIKKIRKAEELLRRFPSRLERCLTLESVVQISSDLPHSQEPSNSWHIPVWVYWEGPIPDWIEDCLKTLRHHVSEARILGPKEFDALWDQDREIDIKRLHVAHRADFIRSFLLFRFGGLWIDADCIVMQSLEPILNILRETDFIAHRDRQGFFPNGFIGARSGSAIAKEFYCRICDILRSKQKLGWISLGGEPLTNILGKTKVPWHEIECDMIQPICWSNPEFFFEIATPERHDTRFLPSALCYMLSNSEVKKFVASNPSRTLVEEGTFFKYLIDRSIGYQIEPDTQIGRQSTPHFRHIPFFLKIAETLAPVQMLEIGVVTGYWGSLVREISEARDGWKQSTPRKIWLEGISDVEDTSVLFHELLYDRIHKDHQHFSSEHISTWPLTVFSPSLDRWPKITASKMIKKFLENSHYVLIACSISYTYDNQPHWSFYELLDLNPVQYELYEGEEKKFFGAFLLSRNDPQTLRKSQPMQQTFTNIFLENSKSGNESVSGPGSSFEQTAEIRQKLPYLLEYFEVRTLLDSPCGDLHWMKTVSLGIDLYIGVDIVPEIIRRNKLQYGSGNRRFTCLDITSDPLPEVDIILCRDCLVHYTYEEIIRTLKNFKRSKSRLLLTTTFPLLQANTDTVDCKWRPINLQVPPFCLPPPMVLMNEKCTEAGGRYADKSLGLWRLKDILF